MRGLPPLGKALFERCGTMRNEFPLCLSVNTRP